MGVQNIPNKKPLMETPWNELPLGAVKPAGWLRNQLEIQADGLTGHLDEFWDSVGSYSGWLGGTGENWERGPYYLDGLLPLAYLLNNQKLITKAQKWVEWTLNSQNADGLFGPANNDDWWPRMVMLKVLIQYQEVSGDVRVVPFMVRYFKYLFAKIGIAPLRDWGKARGGEYLYCIYWLYNRIQEPFLLKLAEIIYRQTIDWGDIFTNFPFTRPTEFYYEWSKLERYGMTGIGKLMDYATHIVNVAMGIKTPGLYFQQSGERRHWAAVQAGIANLAKYHGVVTGMFTGDEHLSGQGPTQGTELCAVAEYMFSLETLLKFARNTDFADLLEKVAYNALPATFTKDMWGHQYLQQVNQVIVSNARRNWYNNNDDANLFGLEPNFGCCTANMHQGWPKLVSHLWMATADHGLVAMIYAPCVVKATVATDVAVSIIETTNYPFEEEIVFSIQTPCEVQFPLKLRIPKWCKQGQIHVNGQVFADVCGGEFATIDRKWQNGDQAILTIPFEITTSTWLKNSVGIERGPLVFALKIGEDWRKLKGTDPYADWEVYPTTPWNYALQINPDNPSVSFEVVKGDITYQPYDSLHPPITLKGKGRRVENWKLVNHSAGELPDSPVISEEPPEEIELIPYGAAKLRIAQFPFLRVENE